MPLQNFVKFPPSGSKNIHRSFIPKASNAFRSFLIYSKLLALVFMVTSLPLYRVCPQQNKTKKMPFFPRLHQLKMVCNVTSARNGLVYDGIPQRNIFLFLNFILALIIIYYISILYIFSIFLILHPYIAFKEYTGISKFQFQPLDVTMETQKR
jgi:hypothetical protein